MKIVVIKYNAGNIKSVEYALKRSGIACTVSSDHETIMSADKVIFPGVGEASSAMNYLRENKLDTLIPNLKQPVLGICLGMQLLCSSSEEGNTNCLNIFPLKVKKFNGDKKVPQIGWNNITNLKSDLFNGITENSYMYFVHSFYVELSEYTIAKCDYTLDYSAAIRSENFYAVQFHPEKSGELGKKIIDNFLAR